MITLHGKTYAHVEGDRYSDGQSIIVVRDGKVMLHALEAFKCGVEWLPLSVVEEHQIHYIVDESKYNLTGYKLLD